MMEFMEKEKAESDLITTKDSKRYFDHSKNQLHRALLTINV